MTESTKHKNCHTVKCDSFHKKGKYAKAKCGIDALTKGSEYSCTPALTSEKKKIGIGSISILRSSLKFA